MAAKKSLKGKKAGSVVKRASTASAKGKRGSAARSSTTDRGGGTPGKDTPKENKSTVRFKDEAETDPNKRSPSKAREPGFKWSEEFAHLKDRKEARPLDSQGNIISRGDSLSSKKGPSAFALDAEDMAPMMLRRSQVVLRYNPMEMMARAMQAQNMYARVMLDAARRWSIPPGAGPLTLPTTKEGAAGKARPTGDRTRRLGRALSVFENVYCPPVQPKQKVKIAQEESGVGLWLGALSGMVPSSALAAAYMTSSAKMRDSMETDGMPIPMSSGPLIGDVCQIEHEPCRRFYTVKCFPCPEHTPGVPRDPRKTCICATEPRPVETQRDAMRFVGMLPRELHATYSSLDPIRKQEIIEREKSEAEWRSQINEWHIEYVKADSLAKNLITRMRAKVPRPPFVEENNSLRRLRGVGSLPLHLV